jgi:hypothetical protein
LVDPGTSYEYFFLFGTFITPQKKSFGQSAILAEWKNCQNGTFEPVHEIQKFFWPKDFC